MFLGDKGKPTKFPTTRLIYDIIIDNEAQTIRKLMRNLGFYTILLKDKNNEVETIYDTDRKLLTSAGLILRKKNTQTRTYFSLVRLVSMKDIKEREKKSFLGECEPNDQPSDFPVQIAEAVNRICNNIFTINLVDVVKHSTPYIVIKIGGNHYKIVSGTGYEMDMSFETLKIKDVRTGRKAKRRIFSLKFENLPEFEHERLTVLDVIERRCKELVLIDRNRFEVAQAAVKIPEKPVEKGKKEKKDQKPQEQK